MHKLAPLLVAAGLSVMGCDAKPKTPEKESLEVAVYIDEEVSEASLPFIELSVKEAFSRFSSEVRSSWRAIDRTPCLHYKMMGRWDSDDTIEEANKRVTEFGSEVADKADIFIGITGQPLRLTYTLEDESEIIIEFGGYSAGIPSKHHLARFGSGLTELIMHELGHNFGLHHTSESNAIMRALAKEGMVGFNSTERSLLADHYISLLKDTKRSPKRDGSFSRLLKPFEKSARSVKGVFTFNGLDSSAPRYILYEAEKEHINFAEDPELNIKESLQVYISASGSLTFEILQSPLDRGNVDSCSKDAREFVRDITLPAWPSEEAVIFYSAYEEALTVRDKRALYVGVSTMIVNVAPDYLKKNASLIFSAAEKYGFFPKERRNMLLDRYANALLNKKPLFDALIGR